MKQYIGNDTYRFELDTGKSFELTAVELRQVIVEHTIDNISDKVLNVMKLADKIESEIVAINIDLGNKVALGDVSNILDVEVLLEDMELDIEELKANMKLIEKGVQDV